MTFAYYCDKVFFPENILLANGIFRLIRCFYCIVHFRISITDFTD